MTIEYFTFRELFYKNLSLHFSFKLHSLKRIYFDPLSRPTKTLSVDDFSLMTFIFSQSWQEFNHNFIH